MIEPALFVTLLTLVPAGDGCGARALKTREAGNAQAGKKESPMTPEYNADVLKWLVEPPFDDPAALRQRPNFSYEEWLERGRSLPQVVDSLIHLLSKDLEHPSDTATRAAYALGFVGDKRPQVKDMLLKAIDTKDANLRTEAVSALGRQGDASVLPRLEALLLNQNEDLNVRANACIAIGRLGTVAHEKILKDIQKDGDPFLSRCAEEALRLLREKATRTR